jgi:hypothetical protein
VSLGVSESINKNNKEVCKMADKKPQQINKAVEQPRPEEEENTFYGVKLKTGTSRRRTVDPKDILGESVTRDMELPNGDTLQVKITPRKFQDKNKVSVGFSLNIIPTEKYNGYGQVLYKQSVDIDE